MLAFLCSVLLPLLLSLFSINKCIKNAHGTTGLLPPGPRPIPVIGSIHLLTSIPHRAVAGLSKAYGPIMLLRLGSIPTVFISSPRLAEQVLKALDTASPARPFTEAAGIYSYGGKDMGFAGYGPRWRKLRKLCINNLLATAKLESYGFVRREEVASFVERMKELAQARAVADVTTKVRWLVADMVCRTVMGRKIMEDSMDHAKFGELIEELMRILATPNLNDAVPLLAPFDLQGLRGRTKAVMRRVDMFLDKIIDDHEDGKGEDEDDFIDVMLHSTDDRGSALDRTSAKAVILDMCLGAMDTSPVTIDWALVELLRHPRDRDTQLKDIQSEISSMFQCRADTFSIKYFLPNNKQTLITVSSDKDLQRMVDFHGDSLTTDIYVIEVMKKAESRKTKSVVADSDTHTAITIYPDDDTLSTHIEPKRPRICNGWDDLIIGVGQVFDGIKPLRDALHKYAIANTFGYRFVKNESQRLTAECTTEGCPWRIHASRSPGTEEFVIKKWTETHTCGRKAGEERNRLANQRWIAGIIKDKLRESPNYRPKDIASDLQKEYGLSINYTQAWRGKFFAKQELHSSHKEACSQLPWLCERILDTNPGSVAALETSDESKFSLFVAFHASLSGFEHGCRPLIFLDGISLKASKQWKLLAANAVDSENSIFPVAFSVVDTETRENWHWFLVQLKSALSTSRTITFISNMKNGLEEDVTQVFEGSYHGYCVHHLEQDFMAQMEETELMPELRDAMVDGLRKCVYTCKVDEFNDCIETIKSESTELAKWILDAKPELWSNAFFKGLRYANYSSDASEAFNSWVTSRYEPSVVQIVDMIRCKMMEMIYTRRESSNSWREILTPSMSQRVQEELVRARNLDVICSTGSVFEVHDDAIHVVNMETWECTCRRWQVTGMTCVHALAVLDRTDGCISEYCSKYFTTECYRLVYSLSIIPIPDAGRAGWIVPMNLDVDADMPLSPHPRRGRRHVGRPKEKPDDPRITVKRAVRCGKCQGLGHNKQTCKATL